MENRSRDEPPTDKAAPLQPRRGSGTVRHPSEDALLLAELADLDESLRERGAAWKELVQRLDALRREIAVESAQARRTRVLVARRASREGDGDPEAKPPGLSGYEERGTRLKQQFETALRQTEERRVALHAAMEDLRRRRQALIGRLPPPIARAYQSLANRGRTPAVATVVNGACGACQAPLPELELEALGQGAVVACAHCERLLRASRGAK